jgi:2-phospho-L-lactate guanylyltransferase
MTAPVTHAIVPVKSLLRAKSRLVSILSRDVRARLARAMLRDVLSALRGARSIGRVWVVSHDRALLADVERLGASPLEEEFDMGLNRALRFATRAARERGAERVLILPSDVPLVRAQDLERLLRFPRGASVGKGFAVVVPSKDGAGTNALLRTPPAAIPPCFGSDSFRRHAREAARRGVLVYERRIARIALDVDTPRDLLAVLATESRGSTVGLLARLGLL